MLRSQREPPRRRSSAEQALARANQRLMQRGSFTKDDSSDNEDDINNYLSSLRKKTAQPTDDVVTSTSAGKRRISIGDGASDISITNSSDAEPSDAAPVAARSKFLKQRRPQPAVVSSGAQKPQQPPLQQAAALGTDSYRRSAALAKASSITGRFATQQRQRRVRETDSEPSVSAVSTTESSDAKRRRRKKGSKAAGKRAKEETERRGSGGSPARSTPEALYAKSSRAKLNYLTDEESASIGRDGAKFLKPRTAPQPRTATTTATDAADGSLTPKTRKQLRFAGLGDEEEAEEDEEIEELVLGRSPKSPATSQSSSGRSTGRYRRSNALDDDDMSTAELGEGLASASSGLETPKGKKKTALRSPDSPGTPKKRVTIAEATPTVEDEESDILSFLEENIVPRLHSSSSGSSGSSSRSGSDDSEAEVPEEAPQGIAERVLDVDDLSSSEASSVPRFGVVQTVDDLSSYSAVSDDERRRKSGAASSSSSSSPTSSTVIRSEARGASQYDSDFEISEVLTEQQTRATTTYSPDFDASSPSRTASSTTRSGDLRRSGDSSEETTTVTESYTRSIRRRRRRRGTDRDKSVQTYEVGLSYAWDIRASGGPRVGPELGMASVDLNPIAHYAVAPESLEAVTAYNPCLVALNNMLRQQLEMTQNFMSTQRRLYEAMSRTIVPSHNYTTLEDTKKFIAKNRPPTISMEEALREVELEMA